MKGRKIFGLILVVLGAGYIFQNLGVLDFSNIVGTWWPMAIILIGVTHILTGQRISGVIVSTIGGLILARKLGYTLELEKFIWPTILVLIGINILWPREYDGSWREVSDDTVDYVAVFSGVSNKNVSGNFKGGSVTSVFGGAEIDLSGATVAPEGAVLDATAVFGGVEVKVPPHWKVVATGLQIFGGWENNARVQEDPEAPSINIKCTVAFGGIEIKN